MSLKDHARTELRAAGLMDADSDYGGMLPEAVMALINTFANQGHSGGSASMVIELFTKLAKYEPLTPLTGRDDEWMNVSEASGQPMWQNKRCYTVFKGGDGRAYDLNGIKRVDADGNSYYASGDCCYIEFPYTPTTITLAAGEPIPPKTNP